MSQHLALGVLILALAAPVTPHQAERAIRADQGFQGIEITCRPEWPAQICTVTGRADYADTLGPAEVVGTSVVEVTRGPHGYLITTITPDHFDIYGATP